MAGATTEGVYHFIVGLDRHDSCHEDLEIVFKSGRSVVEAARASGIMTGI